MATADEIHNALEDSKHAKQAREHWNCVCGHVIDGSYWDYKQECLDCLAETKLRLDIFYKNTLKRIEDARNIVKNSDIQVSQTTKARLKVAKDDMWKAHASGLAVNRTHDKQSSVDIMELKQCTAAIQMHTKILKSELLKIPSFIAVHVRPAFSELINSMFDPIEVEQGERHTVDDESHKRFVKRSYSSNSDKHPQTSIANESSDESVIEECIGATARNNNVNYEEQAYETENFESDISLSDSEDEEVMASSRPTALDLNVKSKFSTADDLVSSKTKGTFSARLYEQQDDGHVESLNTFGGSSRPQSTGTALLTARRKATFCEESDQIDSKKVISTSKSREFVKTSHQQMSNLSTPGSTAREHHPIIPSVVGRDSFEYQSRSLGSRPLPSTPSKSAAPEEKPLTDSVLITSDSFGEVEIEHSIAAVDEKATDNASVANTSAKRIEDEYEHPEDRDEYQVGGKTSRPSGERDSLHRQRSVEHNRAKSKAASKFYKQLNRMDGPYRTLYNEETVMQFKDLIKVAPELPALSVLPSISAADKNGKSKGEPKCINVNFVASVHEMKLLDHGFFAFQHCADIKLFQTYFVASGNDKLFKVDRNSKQKISEMKIEGAGRMCTIRNTTRIGLIQWPSCIWVIETANMSVLYRVKTSQPYTNICYLDYYSLEGHLPEKSYGFLGAYSANNKGVVVEALDIVRAEYKKLILGQKAMQFDSKSWLVDHDEIKSGIYSIDAFSASEIVVCSARSIICLKKTANSKMWVETWRIPVAKEATCVCCTKNMAYVCIRDEMRIMAVGRDGKIQKDNILPSKSIKPDRVGVFEDTFLVKEFDYEKWRTLVCEP